MTNIQLSLALAVSEQPSNLTRLILDGTVKPDGIDLIPSDVYSGELIWRQLRFAEFDVAQMSVTALLMLAERGNSPWVACQSFPSAPSTTPASRCGPAPASSPPTTSPASASASPNT